MRRKRSVGWWMGWENYRMSRKSTHNRQDAAVTNFDTQLPQPHAKLAQDTLKGPYIFDFLTLDYR